MSGPRTSSRIARTKGGSIACSTSSTSSRTNVGHPGRPEAQVRRRDRRFVRSVPPTPPPLCTPRRVLRRLEFHYTPKHASWLNMVEIEIGVLKGQCLDRRIDSCHRLMAEIDARQAQRNQIGARITRMFSTDSILSSKIRLLGQAPSLGVACGFS